MAPDMTNGSRFPSANALRPEPTANRRHTVGAAATHHGPESRIASFMQRRPRGILSTSIAVAVTLAATGLLLLASPLERPLFARTEGDVASAFVGQDRFDEVDSVEELRELEREFVETAKRVRPSVVYLRTNGARGTATGTAVIISEDGLLATCGHVGRRPGRPVTAVLPDGTEIKGTTLGQVFDDGVDCGLIQLDTGGRRLPSVALGTTEGLAEGDWVIALGYTQGLREPARPALLRGGRVLFVNAKELYIDAPIDAGDSGGPCFNLRGEVVGLNSRCGRESWQNVATRIDLLRDRMEELRALTEAVDGGDASDGQRRRTGGLPFPPDNAGGKVAVERSSLLDSLTSDARSMMLGVRSAGAAVGFATIVDAAGKALTKASQLSTGAVIEVEFADGRRARAREVDRDAALDVALLAFDVPNGASLRAVSWAIDASIDPGEVLITPRLDDKPAKFGFAAIEERESEADQLEGPFLGVQSRPATRSELSRAAADRGVTISRVVPNTAAERAKLKPGQLILAVNGTEVGTPPELRSSLRAFNPGESVRLTVVTGKAANDVDVVLGWREEAGEGRRRGNTATPISRRSSGFGSLIPHDTVTDPAEMGGPVIDLAGRVVGLNIARFDRTATHAIPAGRMAEVSERLGR